MGFDFDPNNNNNNNNDLWFNDNSRYGLGFNLYVIFILNIF
jgi:hypothetical protein